MWISLSKVRPSLSIIDYLNALPLNLAFKEGLFGDAIELIFDYPSQCADNLASGRVDGGLISSIEYQRIPSLVVVPNVSIAAHERVKSVLVVAAKDLPDVKVLAVDRFSRSSVTLIEVLFHRTYGFKPHIVPMTPNVDDMLAHADAALVIGDAALHMPQREEPIHDLAAWWYRETGMPFVFAFWALRESEKTAWLAERLLEAKDYGLEHIASRLDKATDRWGLRPADIEDYLLHTIHYGLGEAEQASLECFYRYAKECGAIQRIQPLRFAINDVLG